MVNDNTILKKIKPNFGCQQKQHTSVSYINDEAQFYERVTIVRLVFNVSSIEHVKKDGKILCLPK